MLKPTSVEDIHTLCVSFVTHLLGAVSRQKIQQAVNGYHLHTCTETCNRQGYNVADYTHVQSHTPRKGQHV